MSVCLSVCLSALLQGHNFYSILRKFGTEVKGQKLRTFSLGVKIWLSLPHFTRFSHPSKCFLMGRSKQHCNEARRPIVAVNGSLTQLRGRYTPKVEKCYNPLFCPLPKKNKNGDQYMSIIGICLAQCLTQHISATVRDISLVSKDHI